MTQSFNKQDVEIISKETVFQGFFKMIKYRLKHRLFAGGWGEPLQREVFERGHAVAMLPYDPIRDEVVFVEQFRIGAHLAECQPWQLEIVAGIIDAGETAEAVAIRESQEEAGLEVKQLRYLTKYLPSSGGCTETIAVYVGHVDSRDAKGLHGLADEGEDIRVHRVARETAYQWVESGKVENGASIIALQWLQLNYQQLQQQWG